MHSVSFVNPNEPNTSDNRLELISSRAIGTAFESAKPIFSSKTFWVQVLAIVSALFPAVRQFIAGNPVEFIAMLAAVNVIVRFGTSGRVSILPDSSADVLSGPEVQAGSSDQPVSGMLPADKPTAPPAPLSRTRWVWILLCTMAALHGLGLSSCKALSDYPVTGGFYLRDPNSGAKGGLIFSPGKSPAFHASVPVYDESGGLIGKAELSGPLAKEVAADSAK